MVVVFSRNAIKIVNIITTIHSPPPGQSVWVRAVHHSAVVLRSGAQPSGQPAADTAAGSLHGWPHLLHTPSEI